MKLIKNVHKDILAKSYKDANGNSVEGVSVFVHCLIVGIVCREFTKYLPTKFVKKFNITDFYIWCARHDIGKISPGFQYIIQCAIKGNIKDTTINDKYVMRHETVSGAYLNEKYWKLLEKAPCVLSMIKWHHGGDRTERYDNGQAKFYWSEYDHSAYGDGKWDTFRDDVDNALIEVFGNGTSFIDTWYKLKKGNASTSIHDSEVKYMMGLLSVCDWIGSDDCTIFKINDFMGDEIDIDRIAEYANLAINQFGLNFSEIECNKSFNDLFEYNPYALQSSFPKMVDNYGLYIIEAPMGYGKTEAALAGAYTAINKNLVNGIYFALPTQMTSNSMLDRYKKFVDTICNGVVSDVRLVHGKAVYASSNNNGMYSWFHGNKRGTLAQFGLGTIDQALMSVISSMKYFYIRSFGLANKAIIIDEIHSYDVYTGALVHELISDLIKLDCVIIVLSATLTAKNRGELTGVIDNINQYPLITKVSNNDVTYNFSKELLDNRKYSITMHKLPINSDFINNRLNVLSEALNRVKHGELVLWIENTVNDSQAIYNWFSNHLDNVGLLNSWFTNADREENESKWVNLYGKDGKRNNGLILVSTQVCEQSIDIDADFLVTALCPTDMLLQRLGREHRHYKKFKRNYTPECIILAPIALESYKTNSTGGKLIWEYKNVVGSCSWVYSLYILKRTYNVWNNIKTIELPRDIRTVMELTYDDKYVGDNIDIELKEYDARIAAQNKLDALNTISSGLGNRVDNDNITTSDDQDIEETKTRKIAIPTREVYLISSYSNDMIETIYGDTLQISDYMKLNDRKLLNKCEIKVKNKHIERYSNVFITKKIGKFDYIFCVLNNGISTDLNGRIVADVQYSKSSGLVIKK